MADGRPGEDATSTEIAEWLERDFWDSVTDGVKDALDDGGEPEASNTDDG